MKWILRKFGLFTVKDIKTYLKTESEGWKKERDNLTNHDDILYENAFYRLAHYKECVDYILVGINNLNKRL